MTQTRDTFRGEIPRQPNLDFIQMPKDKQLFGLLSHRAIVHLLSGVAVFSDNIQFQQECDHNLSNERVGQK